MHINEMSSLSPAHFCILIWLNKPLPSMHIDEMSSLIPAHFRI